MLSENTILLVDRDKELCDALEKYLTRHAYDVIRMETGQMALSTIPNNSPCVVISGTQLKDMTGIELLRKLRKKFPQEQVIMIVDKEGEIRAHNTVEQFGAFHVGIDGNPHGRRIGKVHLSEKIP